MKNKLIIGYLYGDLMNIYGDTGNIIALQKRAQWRGIEVEIKNISIGDKIKSGECNIYFFGGGQDQAQELVASDLESSGKGKIIKQEVEKDVPLLAICGGYQLLGDYYQPHKGPKLPGVGLFPTYTVASFDRMIGNLVISSEFMPPKASLAVGGVHGQNKKSMNNEPPESASERTQHLLVGFENHSGKTYLKKGAQPLGKVIKGFGNNGSDKSEGCIYKNAIGCYMHGSLLPKNPQLADWLLEKALGIKLEPLDDELENKAHDFAISKFG